MKAFFLPGSARVARAVRRRDDASGCGRNTMQGFLKPLRRSCGRTCFPSCLNARYGALPRSTAFPGLIRRMRERGMPRGICSRLWARLTGTVISPTWGGICQPLAFTLELRPWRSRGASRLPRNTRKGPVIPTKNAVSRAILKGGFPCFELQAAPTLRGRNQDRSTS